MESSGTQHLHNRIMSFTTRERSFKYNIFLLKLELIDEHAYTRMCMSVCVCAKACVCVGGCST